MFHNGGSYFVNDCLRCVDNKQMLCIANLTTESKVKVKHAYIKAVWIIMPTNLTTFDGGYSYLSEVYR